KALLDDAEAAAEGILYSDHIEGQGPQFLRSACAFALEGVVSKRRNAPYRPGRGRDWVKSKCGESGDFIIGGFVPPTSRGRGVGSLLLGQRRDGRLTYVGKVGTGFTEAVSAD